MAILVILVLAILWAAVLVPPILRSRAESGAAGGISDFFGRMREGLGHRAHGGDPSLPALQPIMGPVSPMGGSPMMYPGAPVGPVQVPGGMSPAQRRRRDVLVGLLGAVGITLVMALFSSGVAFWVLHLLADVLLVGYVYLLLQRKARSRGGERRPMPARPGPVVPNFPNVHDLTARRFPPATAPSRVEAPREATVLALRRSASW
ncbi:MAG: hypothetical protein WD598_13770 [Acidimicrobiia bacterium]